MGNSDWLILKPKVGALPLGRKCLPLIVILLLNSLNSQPKAFIIIYTSVTIQMNRNLFMPCSTKANDALTADTSIKKKKKKKSFFHCNGRNVVAEASHLQSATNQSVMLGLVLAPFNS